MNVNTLIVNLFPIYVVIHKRVIWFRRPVQRSTCFSGSTVSI